MEDGPERFSRIEFCAGEADGANAIRMLECGHDILLILKSRGIKLGISSVAHNERKGWPTVQSLQDWRVVRSASARAISCEG
jgi:hypothetical protein